MTQDLTQAALQRLCECQDARFKTVMSSLITHLHDFIRDVNLTGEEWMTAINFLTDTGKACTDMRQEFILLSDTLGVSMLVVLLNQHRGAEAVEATVQGPYYWEGAPQMENGANIAEGVKGEPTYYSGRVLDEHSTPIANACLDVWSGDGEGNYDMQLEGKKEMRARAKLYTDAEGRYAFWSIRPSYYPVPVDGPVGKMLLKMGRHPNRPGHMHFMLSAAGFESVTTHLFVADSPYLDSDAVFGVRDSLIVPFTKHPAGVAPDGSQQDRMYYTACYDFQLTRAGAADGKSA